MNKGDLIDAVVVDTDLTKVAVSKVLNSIIENVKNTLINKEKLTIVGFGTFLTRERAARNGRNPKTGKEIKIEATTVPAFKPSEALKETIRNSIR